MPVADTFDVQPYVRPPRLSAWKGIILCLRLIMVAPPDASSRTRAALEALRAACVKLQAAARGRLALSQESLRPYDAALDSGWIALRMALESVGRLTGTPEADQAVYLLPRVLPRGTDFVAFAYEQEWTESDHLLTRIDEERLEDEIEAAIGPKYLAFIRRAHAEFGEALGLGETPRTTTETTALAAAINDVAFAIAEYGRLMVGELDRNDPVNVERFKKAMAPLDAYRASNTSRRSGGEEEDIVDIDEPAEPEVDVDPNGPIPPIPGDPAQV